MITAPYGFVPLSAKVVQPAWLGDGKTAPDLHDRPLPDGLSGTLQLSLVAETPIFTRDAVKKQEFFTLDGQPAIPGTALKGAFRNVVEAVAFGWMARVNDHKYAIRDLNNRRLYGDFMAKILPDARTGKQLPMPLVSAGLLRRDEDGYVIDVRDFAKIEYSFLENIAAAREIRGFWPGRKQSSVDKYRTWGTASREVDVEVDFQRPHELGGLRFPSRAGKVRGVGAGIRGRLVFTGQPSEYRPDPNREKRPGQGNPKHHDFIFFQASRPKEFRISEEVFKNFTFGHSDGAAQHSLNRGYEPNAEWGYWKEKLERKGDGYEPVPVFFLTTPAGDEVTDFGLAMMFRLPYKYSTLGAVEKRQHGVREASRPLDLAEGLFGTVRDSEGHAGSLALKSRVHFSHAIATKAEALKKPISAILSGPRASYYPNYVEQDETRPGYVPTEANSSPIYKTWHDGAPRGWKRYRPKAGDFTDRWIPPPPTGANGRALDLSKVGTTFTPLNAGATFRSDVVVHNVNPVELGALVWAIRLGGDPAARHMLGLARPLGFGRCRATIGPKADLRDHSGNPVDLDACVAAFERYMAEQVPNWATSDAIVELKALAIPANADDVRYQRLDPGQRVNDFVEAKRRGNGWTLPRASGRLGGDGPTVSSGARDSRQQTGQPSRDARPSQTPPTSTPQRRGWPGKRRDDVVRVQLTSLNPKGKWRCTVVGFEGTAGTLEGTAPAEAAASQEFDVLIVSGNDGKNLNLKWKGV